LKSKRTHLLLAVEIGYAFLVPSGISTHEGSSSREVLFSVSLPQVLTLPVEYLRKFTHAIRSITVKLSGGGRLS